MFILQDGYDRSCNCTLFVIRIDFPKRCTAILKDMDLQEKENTKTKSMK